MLRVLFVILYLFTTANVSSQTKLDSLKNKLNQTLSDTTKIQVLFELGNEFIDGPSDSLIHYYHQALSIINENLEDNRIKKQESLFLSYQKFYIRVYIELGIELYYQSKNDESVAHYHKALKTAQKINDKNLISEIYGALGIVYKSEGNYSEALNYYDQALQLAIELQDTAWIASCYSNAGNIFRRTGKYTNALEYYLKALRIFEESNEPRRISICLLNLGNLYDEQKDYDKALSYYKRSLNLAQQTQDKLRMSGCFLNIGSIYSVREDFDSARYFFNESLILYKESGYTNEMDDCYNFIGITYEKQSNYSKALEYYQKAYTFAKNDKDFINQSEILNNIAHVHILRKEYEKGLVFASNSLDINQYAPSLQNSINSNKYMAQCWEEMNNTDKAIQYYKSYCKLKDSLFNADKYKAITEMEFKYESEKKEQQLTVLTQKNQLQSLVISRRNRLILTAFSISALLILIAYLILRSQRLKAKHQAVELEQKLLRSQMNPHFIFNSLIAIQSYIYKKEAVKAGDFLAQFANLVRITLEHSRAEFVLLSKEITMLKLYLDLQLLRFDDKFDYSIQIDETLNPDDLYIPPMLAQPFIENAIDHGLRHKKNKGYLMIELKKVKEDIQFIIEDNGVGRRKAEEIEKKQNHKSMATSITKERLEVLHKKLKRKFSLKIIDLFDKEGQATGTLVKLILPVKNKL